MWCVLWWYTCIVSNGTFDFGNVAKQNTVQCVTEQYKSCTNTIHYIPHSTDSRDTMTLWKHAACNLSMLWGTIWATRRSFEVCIRMSVFQCFEVLFFFQLRFIHAYVSRLIAQHLPLLFVTVRQRAAGTIPIIIGRSNSYVAVPGTPGLCGICFHYEGIFFFQISRAITIFWDG